VFLHGKKGLGEEDIKGWHSDKILVHLKEFAPIFSKYKVLDLWNWKIWISLLFMAWYKYIFVYEFFLNYFIGIQYMTY